MKMTIALFKSRRFGGVTPIVLKSDGTCWAGNDADYCRISQNADVEFKMLDQEQILRVELDAIDEQERKAKEAYALQLAGIAADRAALSAGEAV